MTTAIVELDASHPSGFSDHNPINLKTNVQWTASSAVRTTHNGVAAWDLNAAALEAPATDRHLLCPAAPYGYTTATWVDWRDSDSGWRTLHRADTGGHLIIVENGNKNLGVYSNYNGGFRDSGYDISTSGWQLVVSVSEDDDGAADGGVGGTTRLYVGTALSSPTLVGTSDRAPGCGRNTYRVGWGTDQGPGYVAHT